MKYIQLYAKPSFQKARPKNIQNNKLSFILTKYSSSEWCMYKCIKEWECPPFQLLATWYSLAARHQHPCSRLDHQSIIKIYLPWFIRAAQACDSFSHVPLHLYCHQILPNLIKLRNQTNTGFSHEKKNWTYMLHQTLLAMTYIVLSRVRDLWIWAILTHLHWQLTFKDGRQKKCRLFVAAGRRYAEPSMHWAESHFMWELWGRIIWGRVCTG